MDSIGSKMSDPFSPNFAQSHPELPLPERYYRRLGIASRSTFQRWENQGLKILKIGGRRFIFPSVLKSFMEIINRVEPANCVGRGGNQMSISESVSVPVTHHDSPSNMELVNRPHVDHDRVNRLREKGKARR